MIIKIMNWHISSPNGRTAVLFNELSVFHKEKGSESVEGFWLEAKRSINPRP